MGLPININDLINGLTVEWERIEFKEGWNPLSVLHSICAFANDFNNWGGGYIVIGIKEKNKKPILPPKGITQKQANEIQSELLNLCHRLRPNYFPKVEPVVFHNKLIIVIWIYGGQERPYKTPLSLTKNTPYTCFIRRYNNTVKTSQKEERELNSYASIPFDDRINYQYELNDLKLQLIQSFLKDTKSNLYNVSEKIPFEQLCQQLEIIGGFNETTKPKNIGLMFFNDHPERVFPKSQIEIVHLDGEGSGKSMVEKIFSGAIHIQIRDALNYLKNNVLKEQILKESDKAESKRNFNYPFAALEEALVNAMYHRSYEISEPVEVRIQPDQIDIVSYPGPDNSISLKDLKKGRVIARRYRNRRIGDFLKELNLTEGRCTGIPTIIQAMKENGSPSPIFKTDKERSYFIASFKIHPLLNSYESDSSISNLQDAGNRQALTWHQVGTKSALSQHQVKKLLKLCQYEQQFTNLMKNFNWKDRTKFRNKFINPLLEIELLSMTIPDKPNSKNQKYCITEKGKLMLK